MSLFLIDIDLLGTAQCIYENLIQTLDIMSDVFYHRAGHSNIVVDILNIPTFHLYSIHGSPQTQDNTHPFL